MTWEPTSPTWDAAEEPSWETPWTVGATVFPTAGTVEPTAPVTCESPDPECWDVGCRDCVVPDDGDEVDDDDEDDVAGA